MENHIAVSTLTRQSMSYRSLISKRVLHHCRAYTPNCPRKEYATAVRIHHDRKPTPFGQPLFPSHPHLSKSINNRCTCHSGQLSYASSLVQPGEVTPGISADEYERRRKALMERLPADSIVVSVAGQIKYMSGRECLNM